MFGGAQNRMVASCAIALALVACRRAGPADRLAADLGHKLAQRGIVARASCPDFEPRAGARVACTAEDRAGRPIAIEVTLRDEARAFDWQIAGTIVDTRQLGQELTAQRRGWAVLACEDEVVVLAAGASLGCAFVEAGMPRWMTITATGDPRHRLSWEVRSGAPESHR